ncbi:uncharacterized protein LOC126674885 [Mercurialis annua]|uniref:uncharacterized protein LOC126674885 n=1 Tax=Mercurialis annua TaxID=3986 RepID=UPI00215E2CDA|nr:uncharacterized protein LOC126674885 [Mercurialis annua]
MEKIMETLKLAELRKEDLRKSCEQVHAQAFTLQWKILEAHFDLTRAGLLYQAQELALKEKKLVEDAQLGEQRDQEVEIKLSEVKRGLEELERNQESLSLFNLRIEQCDLKLSLMQQRSTLARRQVDESNEMLRMKRDQLSMLQYDVESCVYELSVKRNQLSMVQKSLEDCNLELESKKMKLGLVNSELEECDLKLSSMQKKLTLARREVDESNEMVRMKRDQLGMVQNQVEKCTRELSEKEKQLGTFQKSLEDCNVERESKEMKLGLVNSELEECSKKLFVRNGQLMLLQRKLEMSSEELETKEEQLEKVKILIRDCNNDLVLKQKELELKEKQPDDTVSQHEQAPESQEVLRVPDNFPGGQVFPSNVKIEPREHVRANDPVCSFSAQPRSDGETNERNSASIRNEDMSWHDRNPHEVLATLRMSSDPVKFVLDVMNGGANNDASVIRSKAVLLEQLMKLSLVISPLVKEEARKVAISWTANMKLDYENSMEIWAFLLFSLIYKVVPSLERDTIFRLLVIVAHHKEAPSICRILAFNERVPEIIQCLIARQQHIAAVRFSCAFELIDKFPPENILGMYVEHILMATRNSKNGEDLAKQQDKAIDEELDALRTVLECLAECKFESNFLTGNIYSRIAELGKQKARSTNSLRYVEPSPSLVVQQQDNSKRPRIDNRRVTRSTHKM